MGCCLQLNSYLAAAVVSATTRVCVCVGFIKAGKFHCASLFLPQQSIAYYMISILMRLLCFQGRRRTLLLCWDFIPAL